ncbi:serine protease, partial [Streptomyces solincola]
MALVGAGVTVQSASASASEDTGARVLSVSAAGSLSASLQRDLGGGAAGAFYDASARKLVVNVVDEAAAKRVRAAGGEARIV